MGVREIVRPVAMRSIVLLQRLGASTVVAFIVAGQMLGALAFDQFGLMGLERLPATPLRLAGALLLIGGVIPVRLQFP